MQRHVCVKRRDQKSKDGNGISSSREVGWRYVEVEKVGGKQGLEALRLLGVVDSAGGDDVGCFFLGDIG